MNNETRYRLGRELYKMVEPYSELNRLNFTDREQNEARRTLIEFFDKLKRIDPNPIAYARSETSYYSYIRQVLDIKKDLDNNDYIGVCGRLERLFMSEDLLQQRVYVALIYTLNIWKEKQSGEILENVSD